LKERRLRPKLNKTPPPPENFPEDTTLLTKKPPSMGGVTPHQLEESVKKGGPSTHAAHVAEALEAKEDGSQRKI